MDTLRTPVPAPLPVPRGGGSAAAVVPAATGATAVSALGGGGGVALGGGKGRTGAVTAGRLRLTVGGPHGTEVEQLPAGAEPEPGPFVPSSPPRVRRSSVNLVEREQVCARARELLAQGRSVRVVGPHGSGRTAVVDVVCSAAAGLAPHGLIRLSGHRRGPGELAQDLFAATGRIPGHRPTTRLPDLLLGLRAVVVVDDMELEGEQAAAFMALAPGSVFLFAALPEQAAPGGVRPVEELRLDGLSRSGSLALLTRLAGRALDESERAWAVDLWFESEGLPLRFVQAAVLLRHREWAIEALAGGLAAGGGAEPFRGADGYGAPGYGAPAYAGAGPAGSAYADPNGHGEDPVQLPSVAESAAPAARIARGLSEPAQRVLRVAVALGGECPAPPHLSALVDVGHAEAALEELVEAGLAVDLGPHHRLTPGTAALLASQWSEPGQPGIPSAARHFAWWTGHGSVTAAQISAEAEVLLAVAETDLEAGRHEQVVLLARAAAPAFALTQNWSAWARALRHGLEAAREAQLVAEEAAFHHDLGVLHLACEQHERARAELEASVALRGALGDARGTAAGRQALELVQRPALAAGAAGADGGARSGLRRLSPHSARRVLHSSGATRRQKLRAAAGVVVLGGLGAAVAVGVGVFNGGEGHAADNPQRDLAGTSTPDVDPVGASSAAAPAGSGSASPSASPSASASGSASGSASKPAAPGTASGLPVGAGVNPWHPAGTSGGTTTAPPPGVAAPSTHPSAPASSGGSGPSHGGGGGTSAKPTTKPTKPSTGKPSSSPTSAKPTGPSSSPSTPGSSGGTSTSPTGDPTDTGTPTDPGTGDPSTGGTGGTGGTGTAGTDAVGSPSAS